jgi:uncharacterized protein
MSQLGDALFTTTQQKVLGLLYSRPEKTFYTKEILRMTGMGVATIKRELDRMLASGIISMTRIGNQHHYQANEGCPIYSELLGIVRKTFGISDVIKNALMTLDNQIVFSFIYGSIAKGEETTASDIDILLIADGLAYADVMARLMDAEQLLGRPVNPSIYTLGQIKEKLQQNNAFISRVMEQPKIWLKGSEDDVRAFR